ncbi:MAG TPA: glycosyltransferase [Pirellulales bacterium]|jgi:glycosyltransferase involved in cell wall biosynthesis|nr:glycosyltransferase [Pirellulales bacterium]
MKTAFIIPTYNQASSLRKCLLGVLAQTERDFETIVADDGSGPETSAVLQRREFKSLRIRHLWQPDRGWRKNRILNLALASTDADYCIFIDGDSIPKADYVEMHLRNRQARCYLSGARVHLPEHVHPDLTDDDILSNRIFNYDFLLSKDPGLARYRHRLGDSRWRHVLNFLTYRPRVWLGTNCSAWRKDLVKVNGFNETFGYGSDDRELGMRLSNAGVWSKYLKYTLIQAHLMHPYMPNYAQLKQNRRRFQRLYFVRETWSPVGMDTILERYQEEQEPLTRRLRIAA